MCSTFFIFVFGALNFYNTKAKIKNCRFFRIDSEDAINFISTNYLIDGVTFEENGYDFNEEEEDYDDSTDSVWGHV